MKIRLRTIGSGALAGLVAALPMSLVMHLLRRRLPAERARRAPPREVVDRAVAKADPARRPEETEQNAVATAAHLGFGSFAGAGYGALLGSGRGSLWQGTMYGLAVWAVMYGAGLPALSLHPAATHDTNDRNEVLIAGHIAWGLVLGAFTASVLAEGERDEDRS